MSQTKSPIPGNVSRIVTLLISLWAIIGSLIGLLGVIFVPLGLWLHFDALNIASQANPNMPASGAVFFMIVGPILVGLGIVLMLIGALAILACLRLFQRRREGILYSQIVAISWALINLVLLFLPYQSIMEVFNVLAIVFSIFSFTYLNQKHIRNWFA
jgi:hypothetical protein